MDDLLKLQDLVRWRNLSFTSMNEWDEWAFANGGLRAFNTTVSPNKSIEGFERIMETLLEGLIYETVGKILV